MGGSGKTTLAKEIYNRKFLSMDRSSFVFNVRDAEAKCVLHKKQRRLLEDPGVKGVSFDDTEQGKAILASRLISVSVLIVLDDVDHTDQMDALLPAKDILGRGSLVIVTTTDKKVLQSRDISSVYEMKKLDPLHAKQRFCSKDVEYLNLGREYLNQLFPRQIIDVHEQEEKKTSIGEIKPTTAGSLREIVEFPSCSGTLLPYSAGAEKIGVNNGLMGDNLPPQDEVVTLMQNNNIGKLRIYKAEPHVLEAFANSGIEIIIGVANFELRDISSNQEVANMWVDENIIPYYPATNIKYIAVGNQAFEKTKYGLYVLSAMNNIQIALEKANLQHRIKVSTTHGRAVIPMSLLPSKGTFNNRVKNKMRSVLQFLDDHGSPYMANIYPYFAYLENPNISIDYALFKSTAPTVIDGD
ncbi:hypothetical protein KI387_002532, partial [Taxus chinensis]